MVIDCRIATIGSRTEPSLSESSGGALDRLRVRDRSSASQEFQPIGFVGHLADRRPVHHHEVEQEWRLVLIRPGPARAEDRLTGAQDFRLDEQVAEGRVRRVRRGGGEDDFRVTRDLDRPRLTRAVVDGDAAQLDVVLGRDGDLRVRIEVAVAAAKLGPGLREDRLVTLGAPQRWLVRRRTRPAPVDTSRR